MPQLEALGHFAFWFPIMEDSTSHIPVFVSALHLREVGGAQVHFMPSVRHTFSPAMQYPVSYLVVMPSFGVIHVINQLHVFFMFCHKFYQWPNPSPKPIPIGAALLIGNVFGFFIS